MCEVETVFSHARRLETSADHWSGGGGQNDEGSSMGSVMQMKAGLDVLAFKGTVG